MNWKNGARTWSKSVSGAPVFKCSCGSLFLIYRCIAIMQGIKHDAPVHGGQFNIHRHRIDLQVHGFFGQTDHIKCQIFDLIRLFNLTRDLISLLYRNRRHG